MGRGCIKTYYNLPFDTKLLFQTILISNAFKSLPTNDALTHLLESFFNGSLSYFSFSLILILYLSRYMEMTGNRKIWFTIVYLDKAEPQGKEIDQYI